MSDWEPISHEPEQDDKHTATALGAAHYAAQAAQTAQEALKQIQAAVDGAKQHVAEHSARASEAADRAERTIGEADRHHAAAVEATRHALDGASTERQHIAALVQAFGTMTEAFREMAQAIAASSKGRRRVVRDEQGRVAGLEVE